MNVLPQFLKKWGEDGMGEEDVKNSSVLFRHRQSDTLILEMSSET